MAYVVGDIVVVFEHAFIAFEMKKVDAIEPN